MAVDYIQLILAALTLFIPAIIGWFAGQATLKKALTATMNTFDEFTDVVEDAKAMRVTLGKALEDNTITEEEYRQIYASYEEVMKEIDEFNTAAKGMIEAYRELFGVIISAFRKKF